MLDWLKYLPLSIEQDSINKPSEIRGPYFSKLRESRWLLGSSSFHFNAPWSNSVFSFDGSGSGVDSTLPKSTNILSGDWEAVYYNSDAPPSQWNYNLFYDNTWYFVGPWFSGIKERLKASGILVSAKEDSLFFERNLFHPRVFESAISSHLDYAYGYRRSGKKPHYRGPLNWHVLPISPTIQGIVCDIHHIANGGKDNPSLLRMVFFPVSSQQFIRINFDFGGVVLDDEIRAKPLFELCDSIVNSMRLEVGASTQAEWNKVKSSCPDMSLSESFGELPWPLMKEKSGKKMEADITPNKPPKALQSE